MNKTQKLELTITILTVMLMYFMITKVIPMLRPLIESSGLHNAELLNAIMTFLGGVGFYLIIKNIARYLLESIPIISPILRKFYLGSAYLEGTWVGYFTAGAERIVTVEHFEQTMYSLNIKGRGFKENREKYARWRSNAVSINAEEGILSYSYICHRSGAHSPIEGVAEFSFERYDPPRKPPYVLDGFSADIPNGIHTDNTEYKFSNKTIPRFRVLNYIICLETSNNIDNKKLGEIIGIYPRFLWLWALLLRRPFHWTWFIFTPSRNNMEINWKIDNLSTGQNP